MRALAIVSGGIIAVGIYLFIAATAAFAPTWIALGLLAIAVAVGLGIVAGSAARMAGSTEPLAPWDL